jgi:hypothetical protein
MATDGYLTFAWVVPGALFVLVLGLIYLRFLLDMPRGRAALFVIAGGLYVCGAIGMEMLGGDYAFENGTIETARYLLLTSVEETMEMGGLLLFAYVLMRGLARPDGRIGLSLDV